MKPYQKGPGLRPLLLGNMVALLLPLTFWMSGRLSTYSPWTYLCLALQVLPLANLLRLLMRLTLGVKANRQQAWVGIVLSLACLGSALWWVPRYAGIALK